MARRGSIAVAVAVGLLVALPAGAGAATVGVVVPCTASKYGGCERYLQYRASAGEANRVSRAEPGGGESLIRDDGATLGAGPGCRQVDEHTVACPARTLFVETGDRDDDVVLSAGFVKLGDGDDRFEGSFASVAGDGGNDVLTSSGSPALQGGPGNDRVTLTGRRPGGEALLTGDEGDDVLVGSAGNETLSGGTGSDAIDAGAGDDILSNDTRATNGTCTPEQDRLLGGAGTDLVSYVCHKTPITVDLTDPGPDGAAGENDVLVSIESVLGGQAGDTLIGDEGPNRLAGGPGADTLRALDGNDHVEGGEGIDVLDAGAGDDTLAVRSTDAWYFQATPPGSPPGYDEKGDRADCGEGDDFVFNAHADLLLPSCEAIELVGVGERAAMYVNPRFMTENKAVFAVRCPRGARDRQGRCSGRLLLSAAGARMERRFTISGAQVRVGVRRPPGAAAGDLARVRVRYDRHYYDAPTAADYLIQLP